MTVTTSARAAAATVGDHVIGLGELHMGSRGRIRTLVGSCVAVTLWHQATRSGAMCHYVLPVRPSEPAAPPRAGWYGQDAVNLLLRWAHRVDPEPAHFVVTLAGGGQQFDSGSGAGEVAARNVALGLSVLQQHGFSVSRKHVGGSGPRLISLDLPTGEVTLRHGPITLNWPAAARPGAPAADLVAS